MIMRSEKYTNRVQGILGDAQSIAMGQDHAQLDPLHVFQALLESSDDVVIAALSRAGANVDELRNMAVKAVSDLPVLGNASGDLLLTGLPVYTTWLHFDPRAMQSVTYQQQHTDPPPERQRALLWP